jgi:hypothetical protein
MCNPDQQTGLLVASSHRWSYTLMHNDEIQLGSEQLLFGLAVAPSGNVTSISLAQSSEWVTITLRRGCEVLMLVVHCGLVL